MNGRRRLTRTELLARMPRAFRPRLDAGQRLDLSLCHHENFDAITHGQAEPSMIWDYVGSVLTWWKVAQLLQVGVLEMGLQLELATRLVERFGATGRVVFSEDDDGHKIELATIGVAVMDELAAMVDRPTAIAAADWSESEVNRIAAEGRMLRQRDYPHTAAGQPNATAVAQSAANPQVQRPACGSAATPG